MLLVGLVSLGLVVSTAWGWVATLNAPEPLPPEAAVAPASAPDMDALGSPPDGVSYVDFGEECDTVECFRIVGVDSEDLDAEESIEAIYTTLLDRGYGRLLPPGEDDPQEVDWVDSALTDGEVIIQGSDQPAAEDTIAHLIIVHADGASS